MTVTLYPPPSTAPFRRFNLDSTGRTVEPDFSKGGMVVVLDAAEEAELIAEGWTRSAGKVADADTLRKIATLDAMRAGIKLRPLVKMRDDDIRKAAAACVARHQR